jgi:hypothetical protein
MERFANIGKRFPNVAETFHDIWKWFSDAWDCLRDAGKCAGLPCRSGTGMNKRLNHFVHAASSSPNRSTGKPTTLL